MTDSGVEYIIIKFVLYGMVFSVYAIGAMILGLIAYGIYRTIKRKRRK